MGNNALPSHLKGKLHNDWPWPFSYTPRSWTSFKFTQPPKLIIGHTELIYINGGLDPSQRVKWGWYLSWPLYFTITFGDTGWYMRVGARWDSIDFYYTFPSFALKRIDQWKK